MYRVRLEKMQVKYVATAEYPVTAQLFHIIENATSFVGLQSLEQKAYRKVECRKVVEKVLEFFVKQDIPLYTNDDRINLEHYKKYLWK